VPVVDELPHQPYLDRRGEGFRWRLGLRPLDAAEWFDDGPDAAGWRAEKQRILDEHHETAFAVLPGIDEEARDVADAIVEHLTAQGRTVSLDESLHPLEAASRLVAEDLVVMVERDGGLVFGGGSVCFPNRWDLRSKLGMSLREVHRPVALLNEQLADPVDGFLRRLRPGRPYWRLGWGIIDVPDGYTPVDGSGPVRPEEPAPEDLYVRVERETLCRVAPTGVVLFTIRTYVSPLRRVASDELARRGLASAIDSMPDPVREYKDLAELGDSLVDYLETAPGSPQKLIE
jgi:hypothetical protein